MAKLYFKFGAMGSSKSAQALMTKFNYEEKGKSVWLIKPAIDTRDDKYDKNGKLQTVVRSRIGLSSPAEALGKDADIAEIFLKYNSTPPADVIICDECQFLTEEQVDQLRYIVDNYDIPVLCFGLRADFQTKLFPGSRRLFELADSISEIKSICKCGRKATVNARIDEKGRIVTKGEQVFLGGNDSYRAMCHKCWMEKQKEQEIQAGEK
ncbi:MAG: thymidine kinase [Clostridia bacterium]|nr:thymidine kinase [Clostridia bacterium]